MDKATHAEAALNADDYKRRERCLITRAPMKRPMTASARWSGVSFLAGEPHSDRPVCVSPMLVKLWFEWLFT